MTWTLWTVIIVALEQFGLLKSSSPVYSIRKFRCYSDGHLIRPTTLSLWLRQSMV